MAKSCGTDTRSDDDASAPARRCRFSVRHLPVQASGISLNIVAIAGLLQALSGAHPQYAWLLRPLRSILLTESCTLQLICFVRMVCLCERVNGKWRSTLLRELHSRRITAAHCALLVAVQLGCGQLHQISEENGYGWGTATTSLVYIATTLNWILVAYFLVLSYSRRVSQRSSKPLPTR
jgi:hypothetical protein